MILPTMTDEQRMQELMTDFRRFYTKFVREIEPKWDKMALKQNVFPKIFRWTQVSASNNNIHIAGNIYGRKAVREGYASMMYTTMRTNKGTHLFMYTNCGEEFLYLFPPHALLRYNDRLSLHLSDAETVDHYICRQVQSNGGGEVDEVTGKCILATDDGIWMGNRIIGNFYIFKTFVDNSLLHDNQLKEGDNCKNDYDEFIEMARKYYKQLHKSL